MSDPFQQINKITTDLGLPADFVDRLFDEDDWSFIIKGSALLESAVIYLLAKKLGNKALEDPFMKIDMSQRIEFLSALDLLTKDDRRMLRKFTKFRNSLAHDPKNTNFKFSEYFMKQDNRANFIADFTYHIPDRLDYGKKQLSREDVAVQYPKQTLWLAILRVLNLIYFDGRNFLAEALAREVVQDQKVDADEQG